MFKSFTLEIEVFWTSKWIREHSYITTFHGNYFIELLFRIIRMYGCLQLWRLNCVASVCLFLPADVENGHVSTNSALRMLFRFMFRVMLQFPLRKLLVLQHIENLNAVSVMRGTSPRNRVAVAACILIPQKEVLCIDFSTFPLSCYASCPVYFCLLHPCLLFILFIAVICLYPSAYWYGMSIKYFSHYKTSWSPFWHICRNINVFLSYCYHLSWKFRRKASSQFWFILQLVLYLVFSVTCWVK